VARAGIFLIAVALIAGMVGCIPASQDLEIRTWYDLDAVRDELYGHYFLMNNLDSTTPGYGGLANPTANDGKGWDPIDDFAGIFEGQGYEIRELFINRSDERWVGLFGIVEEGAVIKNLGVVDVSVSGSDYTGGMVGHNGGVSLSGPYAGGTLTDCYAAGNVNGREFVGGLVGLNVGTLINSHSNGNVTGLARVGGLVGDNWEILSNCYATCTVTGQNGVGGLVGYNYYGTVNDSYSAGEVIGEKSVGGLVGENQGGTVSNSYYDYEEVLINGENIITTGALFDEDFDQWLAQNRFLDVNERLSQEDGHYVVNTVADFRELLAFGQDSSLKFRLKEDLDLATEPNFYIPYLAGEFDGNGHKISNLSFDFDFISHIGLFGYLTPVGKITQVGVESVNITGEDDVGGLVGWNEGTVSSSNSSGSVTGDMHVGGLVGRNEGGAVSDSHSAGSVKGSYAVGGLVGMDEYGGAVGNSYSTGDVTGDGNVGGLVGMNDYGCSVSNSFWDTQASGQATSDGGTGKNTTEMKNIATFSVAGWSIIAVALNETDPAYIWNIVNNTTYPFLSWES